MKKIIVNGVESSDIVGKDIKFVATQLLEGKVVAFPSDTVYGLACIYDNKKAIQKIKQIKGRDENKPLPMMVNHYLQLEGIAKINEQEKKVFEKLTPGALTLILDKEECLPAYVNNGFDTIGVRIPNDQFILDLIHFVKKPLLVTSANRSNQPTGTTLMEVLNQIPNEIDLIVEGDCGSLTSSTIIDLRKGLKIIREGEITHKQIEEVLK